MIIFSSGMSMSIVRGSSPGNFVLNTYEFRLGLPMVDPMVLARSSTVISSLSINVKSITFARVVSSSKSSLVVR